MNAGRELEYWMPAQQQLLLRTLCVGDDVAGSAFNDWSHGADWEDHFDRGSFRLLPAVYKRIEALNIDDPAKGRLRGLYRRSWYRNQRFLRTSTKLHDLLKERGIDVLLLGDLALAAGYYQNVGARFVTGSDLLVRPLQAADAFAAMRSAGWRFDAHEPDRLDYRRSVSFLDPLGEPGTLRWHPCGDRNEESLRLFWGTSIPPRTDTSSMPVPGPTAMLLFLLGEMLEQESWTMAVLLADANAVIGHIEFDWQQLLSEARTHRFAWTLGRMLGCLHGTFGVSMPEQVLQQLSADSSGFCERLELRLYSEKQRDRESLLTPVATTVARYLRFARGSTAGEALVRSPEFLRQYYGTKNLLQIVMRLLGNGMRRAVRLLARTLRRAPQHMTGAGR
jgi:hypothetical protein